MRIGLARRALQELTVETGAPKVNRRDVTKKCRELAGKLSRGDVTHETAKDLSDDDGYLHSDDEGITDLPLASSLVEHALDALVEQGEVKKSGDDYALVVDDDGDWSCGGVPSEAPSARRRRGAVASMASGAARTPSPRPRESLTRRSDDPDNQQHKSLLFSKPPASYENALARTLNERPAGARASWRSVRRHVIVLPQGPDEEVEEAPEEEEEQEDPEMAQALRDACFEAARIAANDSSERPTKTAFAIFKVRTQRLKLRGRRDGVDAARERTASFPAGNVDEGRGGQDDGRPFPERRPRPGLVPRARRAAVRR